jgi:cytoskeleton protein RodZ
VNDEQDNSVADESGETGPRGGERLAQARRKQQISVLDVAKELHIDEPKVRALESNDFDVLGAPVFAKGHLRKYAQLVGVDEADVLADYYAMTRSVALPPLVAGRPKVRQEFSPGPWIALLAALAVALGAYWWFGVRDPDAASSPTLPDVLQPGQPQPELLRPEQLQPDELPSAAVDVDESPAATVVAPRSEPAVVVDEPPLADGQIGLSLLFSGDCWTEIIDADGRRLFFNMGHAGQSTVLRGKAPISALFGNAENVSVQVNGNSYALPAPASANGTVRVAIVSP